MQYIYINNLYIVKYFLKKLLYIFDNSNFINNYYNKKIILNFS